MTSILYHHYYYVQVIQISINTILYDHFNDWIIKTNRIRLPS